MTATSGFAYLYFLSLFIFGFALVTSMVLATLCGARRRQSCAAPARALRPGNALPQSMGEGVSLGWPPRLASGLGSSGRCPPGE